MRERLAREVVDDMDIAAIRAIHARVYVNDEFLGVFPQTEEPDQQPFIDENFSKEGGSLYKVAGYCGGVATFEYKDDHPESYIKRYEPKAGTLDEAVLTDLVPLLKCAAEDDAGLEACLPNYIDVDEWLREMAVDAVLPDVDGLAGTSQNFLQIGRAHV